MKKEILGGIIGGILIIGLFLIIIFSTNIFNYEVKLISGNDVDSLESYSDKIKLIEELMNDGVIVSPQEYTNNIVNYYNTALTILVALLLIFSIMSYLHLQFISKEQVLEGFKENLKSRKFEKLLTETIFGKAEDKFPSLDLVEDIKQKIADLQTDLEEMKGLNNQYLDKEE